MVVLLVFVIGTVHADSIFDDLSKYDFAKYKIPLISDFFTDKYNIEEAAYFRSFESALDDVNDISLPLYELLSVKKSYEEISDDLNEAELLEKKNNEISEFVSEILDIKNEYLDSLKETLPPEGLEKVHANLLSVLSTVEEETIEYTKDDYWTTFKVKTNFDHRNFTIRNEQNIANAIRNFHISLKEYKEVLDSRDEEENPDRLYMLYYTPPSAPFSLSVDSKGSFSVKFKYSTAIGDFAIGRSAADGVKELVIIHNGLKRRYRMAGKSFKFHVPKNNGFDIDYTGEENILTIIVNDNVL